MLRYSDLKEDSGRNFLACFRSPSTFDALEEIALICSLHAKLLSTLTPKYLSIVVQRRCVPERKAKRPTEYVIAGGNVPKRPENRGHYYRQYVIIQDVIYPYKNTLFITCYTRSIFVGVCMNILPEPATRVRYIRRYVVTEYVISRL